MQKRRSLSLVSLYSLVVEHLPSKQEVSGSNPDTGFFFICMMELISNYLFLIDRDNKLSLINIKSISNHITLTPHNNMIEIDIFLILKL